MEIKDYPNALRLLWAQYQASCKQGRHDEEDDKEDTLNFHIENEMSFVGYVDMYLKLRGDKQC